MTKTRIAILFGGKSAEHEVSLQSARNVMNALDPAKYDVIPIAIDKKGTWHYLPSTEHLFAATAPGLAKMEETKMIPVHINPDGTVASPTEIGKIDVAFPVLHGPMGEDGTVQGLLKLANIPFVGPDVLGSAICMDKDVSKRLLRDAGIPVANFVTVQRAHGESLHVGSVLDSLGLPVFVKPANMGSSVGITKVSTKEELEPAIEEALKHDHKILIEGAVVGRELECAVLGNNNPQASVLGEVISHNTEGFYSYAAKYVNEDGAEIVIPTKVTKEEETQLQTLAVKAFQVLCCEGMARVDMFLTADGKAYVNELNTIPGFTNISMYPKLWEASGLKYADLLDKLIELAIERHANQPQI